MNFHKERNSCASVITSVYLSFFQIVAKNCHQRYIRTKHSFSGKRIGLYLFNQKIN